MNFNQSNYETKVRRLTVPWDTNRGSVPRLCVLMRRCSTPLDFLRWSWGLAFLPDRRAILPPLRREPWWREKERVRDRQTDRQTNRQP